MSICFTYVIIISVVQIVTLGSHPTFKSLLPEQYYTGNGAYFNNDNQGRGHQTILDICYQCL